MFGGFELDVELAQHTAADVLQSVGAETECGRDGMNEVHKTRKGEWWQLHGRSAAEVRCAAVMPSAECVGCHGPEELGYQLLRSVNAANVCLAMDTPMVGEPQLRLVGCAHLSRLRNSDTGAMWSVGHNSGISGCHQCGASRVTSDGKGPCMMAAFTASRHFMTMLGAPQPGRSERNGNCSPTRAASSTRCCRRVVTVLTTSLFKDRARSQNTMRGCALIRMSEVMASSAVPMIKEFRKTNWCKHFT